MTSKQISKFLPSKKTPTPTPTPTPAQTHRSSESSEEDSFDIHVSSELLDQRMRIAKARLRHLYIYYDRLQKQLKTIITKMSETRKKIEMLDLLVVGSNFNAPLYKMNNEDKQSQLEHYKETLQEMWSTHLEELLEIVPLSQRLNRLKYGRYKKPKDKSPTNFNTA